jgi:hypothetical protein
MKRYFFAILLFCSFAFIGIAEAKKFSPERIKSYVNSTPRKAENSISTLSKYLVAPFDNDYDKAMAIAFWIASRIKYDRYLYNNGSTSRLIKSYKGQHPNELIVSRVGICGDFADLFLALCRKVGIKAYYISGYAYPAKKFVSNKEKNNSRHAWNYFLYKGKKIYVDTTWMAQASIGHNVRINSLNHRKALKKIKKENKYESVINEFDNYYFDFNYKDEVKDKKYIHEEK